MNTPSQHQALPRVPVLTARPPQLPLLHACPAPSQRSPLTQVGYQVDEAHQQQSAHAQHHQQEKEQDGGHGLHGMVAQMPLGEAHVHQLPVEVTEGGRGGPQPSPGLLLARA